MPTNDPQLGEVWFRRVNGAIDACLVESVESVYNSGSGTQLWCGLRHLSTEITRTIPRAEVLQTYTWCNIERGSVWVDFGSSVVRHVEVPPTLGNWVVESHGLDGEAQDDLYLEVFLSRFEPLGIVVEDIHNPQDRAQVVIAMAAIIRDRREVLTDHIMAAALRLMAAVALGQVPRRPQQAATSDLEDSALDHIREELTQQMADPDMIPVAGFTRRPLVGFARQQIMAAEDAAIFAALDNIADTAAPMMESIDGELTPEEVKALFNAGPPKSVWDRLLDED